MKVSIFTPLTENGNRYISDTYASLVMQTERDWEWVVLQNHGGVLPNEIRADERVKVYTSKLEGVGALKRQACLLCTGDVLLELDHDDLLHCQTVERVSAAAMGGADFIYSDFAEFKDGSWEPNTYDEGNGWEYYPVTFRDNVLSAAVAPEDPLAWRQIFWAPNHLRAWRRSFYKKIGGHDETLTFADDHDLVLRSYLAGGECKRIPECLYFYRVHGTQNVNVRNAEIQNCAARTYEKHHAALFAKIADDRDLRKVDICGGHDAPEDFEVFDLSTGHNLDKRWQIGTGVVGVLRAFDALEHLKDKTHAMAEAYRVLAPGGVMLIMVPSTDVIARDFSSIVPNSGAFSDPTHVSFWCERSFRYYTESDLAKYLPPPGVDYLTNPRFQVSRLRTIERFGVSYVEAELIALKDGYKPMGRVSI